MLLRDLCIFLPECPTIWCDNISALSLASNPVYHARTKHIEVDYHFVREKVLRKDLNVQYVSSADNVADIFTKGLHPRRFQYLRGKLKVDNIPFRLRGPISKTQRRVELSQTWLMVWVETALELAQTVMTAGRSSWQLEAPRFCLSLLHTNPSLCKTIYSRLYLRLCSMKTFWEVLLLLLHSSLQLYVVYTSIIPPTV